MNLEMVWLSKYAMTAACTVAMPRPELEPRSRIACAICERQVIPLATPRSTKLRMRNNAFRTC
jgi:hypothetical protein